MSSTARVALRCDQKMGAHPSTVDIRAADRHRDRLGFVHRAGCGGGGARRYRPLGGFVPWNRQLEDDVAGCIESEAIEADRAAIVHVLLEVDIDALASDVLSVERDRE